MLCISTPNRKVYPTGNPYHVHEYEPEEFAEALSKRFPHVVLYRQTAWLASAILSNREFAAAGSDKPFSSRTTKAESKEPGEEIFTVAVAARRKVPSLQAILSLGQPFEVKWWEKQIDESRRDAVARVANAEALAARTRQHAARAEHRSLNSARRLLDVEEVLAQRNARVFALEQQLETRGEENSVLHERATRAERILAGMQRSLSWRVSAPLRALKRRS
jgi:hypothetical protein